MQELWNFTFVLFILLMATCSMEAQGTVAKKSQPEWKEYTYPEDGFAITSPQQPNPHEDQQFPPASFKAYPVTRSYAYTVRLPHDLAVTLRVYTFPNGCADFFGDFRDMIRHAKDGTLDTAKAGITGKADPSSYRETGFSGYPALEDERETTSHSRYYELTHCADRRLFTFTASWPSGSPKPQALTRIVSSFRHLTN